MPMFENKQKTINFVRDPAWGIPMDLLNKFEKWIDKILLDGWEIYGFNFYETDDNPEEREEHIMLLNVRKEIEKKVWFYDNGDVVLAWEEENTHVFRNLESN